jgi:glycosyltransferase involved in cell wall biosynthesis
MRICICTVQVPFVTGGAELLVESLRAQLSQRGFDVDVVAIPFSWTTPEQVLKCAIGTRLLNLQSEPDQPIDLVITTKFPAYLVEHENKVLWLMHQFRQAYELVGTQYSDYDSSPAHREAARMIREMDNRAIAEHRARFAIAGNPAKRLERFNGVDATVLYPPPPLDGSYRSGEYGDYVFTVGRLNRMKRHDLLIRAIAHARTPVRAVIAGTGPAHDELTGLIDHLGVRDRVELVGHVDDARLLELYAGSLAVLYAPYDEDYGYVTVEAFKSAKPVLTASDSGGVLEFVEEGTNGFVCPPTASQDFAAHLDQLFRERARARAMGEAGRARVASLTWDHVIQALTRSYGTAT